MSKQSHQPEQIFVNDSRREAARWIYEIIDLTARADPLNSARLKLNDMAAEGWEVYLMTSTAILLRRDATGAFHGGAEKDRQRAALLNQLGRSK
jgi:hypothetical protein